MAAVPLCPSLVAVIVADPRTSAVTSPFTLTVATLVALDDHVTTRPDSTLPLASRKVTASCTVPPTATLVDAGDTLTVATGATGATVTVVADVPLFPSLVAVIVAEPAATPVTRPLVFTVATAALLLLHVTTRPVKALPPASRGVAVSCTVCPVVTLADAGATVTDATGASAAAAVAPVTTLDSGPNTAFTLSVPRNATS
jgi:hypothetical protein